MACLATILVILAAAAGASGAAKPVDHELQFRVLDGYSWWT